MFPPYRPHTLCSLFYMDAVTPSPSGATMDDAAAAADAASDDASDHQSDHHHRRQHSRPPDMLSPLEQPPQPAAHGHAAVIPDFHPCALPTGGLLDGRMTDLGCQSRGETPTNWPQCCSLTLSPNRVHNSVLLDLASSPRSATRPLTHQNSLGTRNLTTSTPTRAFHVIVLYTRNKL